MWCYLILDKTWKTLVVGFEHSRSQSLACEHSRHEQNVNFKQKGYATDRRIIKPIQYWVTTFPVLLTFRLSLRGILLKMLFGLIKLVENEGFQNIYKLRHKNMRINITADSDRTVKFNSRPWNVFLLHYSLSRETSSGLVQRYGFWLAFEGKG
jgi:hypothetical protein